MRFSPRVVSIALSLLACSAPPAAAAATFGMRLRPAPRAASEIHAPVVLREAPTNETCLVRRRDGTLEIYAVTKPASDAVNVLRSRDGGLTWTEPARAFALPGQAYYAVQVLEAADGALHAVVHVQGEGPGGYRGRLYEVYHAKRAAGAAAWTAPQRIVPGYIGSIRGFIQLSSGRLLLAVARAIPGRMTAPKSGPDFGWNDTFAYYSDDQGATWRQAPDQLSVELKTPNVTRYGAIEPVLLELRDRRVWMLVRDRQGRLLESISDSGGERWPALRRTEFISSDSPAALLRLRDGRIVLFGNACQNWSDPRSYAMGGREVLHAAISADDGRTWRGFREILHEPPIATRGDRGTAYASAAENDAGKVVVVSGQGEGKRAVVAFAPRWLEETETCDDLAAGPALWTSYGAGDVRRESRSAVALPVETARAGGAAWNFPGAAAGAIEFRLRIPAGLAGVSLSLTDHFSRIDDRQAAEHAVFGVTVEQPGPHAVTLRWDRGELLARVDGVGRRTAARRPAFFGVNYLRVEFSAGRETGSVLVSDLIARAKLP